MRLASNDVRKLAWAPTVANLYQRQVIRCHLLESTTSARKVDTPHGHKYLEMDEKKDEVDKNTSRKRWPAPVTIVVIAVVGAVGFGAGFAVSHFAVPVKGKSVDDNKNIRYCDLKCTRYKMFGKV